MLRNVMLQGTAVQVSDVAHGPFVCFSFHLFDPMFIYYDFSKIVSKVAFYLFLLWIKVKIIINKNPSRKTLGFSILTIVFVIIGTVSILIPICKCPGSPKLYKGVC